MNFVARFTKPEAGNKYYNQKDAGGYNPCIKGKPMDPGCNVLANCVGFEVGRFNEIINYEECIYLGNTDAKNFIKYCKSQGLELGQKPKLGACMVWSGGKGNCGHVESVEKIISTVKVICGSSNYNGKEPFVLRERIKGNGNWGLGSNYKFLGFIYNPGVDEEWQPGEYITLNKKYVRTQPKVGSNYILIKNCKDSFLPKLDSINKNDKAKTDIGMSVVISKFIYDNKGNLWGKIEDNYPKDSYICVLDDTGYQAKRID